MPALSLEEARRIGFDRFLLTCDQDNVGSRRVIEANGGVPEHQITVPVHKGIKRRSWITL
jgi:predicted acetyltransferase